MAKAQSRGAQCFKRCVHGLFIDREGNFHLQLRFRKLLHTDPFTTAISSEILMKTKTNYI